MQHIENDMDDLFKRAADNYPLGQGSGDWESIARKINDQQVVAPPAASGKNKGYRKIVTLLLLLLLIFPAGWLLLRYRALQLVLVKSHQQIAVKKTAANDKPSIEKNESNIARSNTNTDPLVVINADGRYIKKPYRSYRNILISTKAGAAGDVFSGTSQQPPDMEVATHETATEKQQPVSDGIASSIVPVQLIKEQPAPVTPSNIKAGSNDVAISSTQSGNEIKTIAKAPGLTSDKKNVPQKTEGFPKKKGIYIGVVTGPDLNKVQSMKFEQTGFDAGLLAGFGISPRLSFETGINWNKKYYSSEGKNFNMDKIRATMAPGMVIDNLETESSLIEIPIKLRYDLVNKKNVAFFVTAGVSAYIMTMEQNKYNVTMNGSPEKITGTYTKNNYGLPAVANISIGYQHNISGRLDLRLEPFLKIPIRGMGVGSLPITSTGLQIGIIRRLH